MKFRIISTLVLVAVLFGLAVFYQSNSQSQPTQQNDPNGIVLH